MGTIARDPSFTRKEPESVGHVDESEGLRSDLKEPGFLPPTTGCPGSNPPPPHPLEMFSFSCYEVCLQEAFTDQLKIVPRGLCLTVHISRLVCLLICLPLWTVN